MATITGKANNWTVSYAGRMASGFSSLYWAVRFAENMGLVVSDLAGEGE